MDRLESLSMQVNAMRQAARYDETLSLLLQWFKEAEHSVEPPRATSFIILFQCRMLAEHYAPARAALKQVQGEQVGRILAGDLYLGQARQDGAADDRFGRVRRFALVTEIDGILKDSTATYRLFAQLDAEQPDVARRNAGSALPAVIDAGDFLLAERYLRDPLALLQEINEMARTMPLFPPPRQAPRLAGDLTNLAQGVRLGMAISNGLGRAEQSAALHRALMDGLESEELRTLVQRELDHPGTISREVGQRQVDQEIAAGQQ